MESRSNAQSDAPEAGHSGAISARASEFLRNRFSRRAEFYDREKEKEGLFSR
jgi:hypothetical protein